jgi:hypothetical protein
MFVEVMVTTLREYDEEHRNDEPPGKYAPPDSNIQRYGERYGIFATWVTESR